MAPLPLPLVALADDYGAPPTEELAAAPRRAIALVERELENEPNMLTMRELAPAEEDYTGPAVVLTDGALTTRYRSVAAHFEDTTTFLPMLGRYEVWQLIGSLHVQLPHPRARGPGHDAPLRHDARRADAVHGMTTAEERNGAVPLFSQTSTRPFFTA